MRISVPEIPLSVCAHLQAHGFESWLVGGAIRDSIIGREPTDWDVATNARPQDVGRIFAHVIDTGLQHGTVTVLIRDERVEVTTYRADGNYSDGRHPDEVRFVSTIDEDLARRDFTMNALAYDPISDELRDPFGGSADISRWIIRAVGDAETRFWEDGLRMLRAARFAATLNFKIDPETEAAINGSVPFTIAQERISEEFRKALMAEYPQFFLAVLATTRLLGRIIPEMLPMIGCLQNRYHEFDVWEHTLNVLHACPPSLPIRLAAVFHDIAKPQTKDINPKTGDVTFYDHENVGADLTDSILERLRFSNDERQAVVHLVRHHLVPYVPSWSASVIRRWVRKVGAENVDAILALARADIAGKGAATVEMKAGLIDELESRINNMVIYSPIVTCATQLSVSGNDVMQALGIGPGPSVGAKLKELLELVTDAPELNTRESLLAILEQSK